MKSRLALLAGTTLLCLALGEAVVRAVIPQAYSISWQSRDARGLMVHPARGTERHSAYGRTVEYRFNPLRLRGAPVPEDGLRALLLGDSFTFGWLLEEDSTAAAHLQARADSSFGSGAVRILNGGVADWGTGDYVAFVEEYGDSIRPDVVVVFLNFVDVARSARGLWALEGDSLVARVPPVPREGPITRALEAVPGFRALRRHSQLYMAARAGVHRLGAMARGDAPAAPGAAEAGAEEDARRVRALFRRLKAWCEARDARLVVLSSGFLRYSYPDWNAPLADTDANLRFLRSADSFFAAESIPWHDLSPDVRAAADGDWDRLLIPRDQHPNEAGARALAGAAWPRLAPHLAAERGGL